MDKIIKKIKCLVLGHDVSISQCPVTKASLSKCLRCGAGDNSHRGVSFK